MRCIPVLIVHSCGQGFQNHSRELHSIGCKIGFQPASATRKVNQTAYVNTQTVATPYGKSSASCRTTMCQSLWSRSRHRDLIFSMLLGILAHPVCANLCPITTNQSTCADVEAWDMCVHEPIYVNLPWIRPMGVRLLKGLGNSVFVTFIKSTPGLT